MRKITQPLSKRKEEKKKKYINHATSPKLYRSYYPHRREILCLPYAGFLKKCDVLYPAVFCQYYLLKISLVIFYHPMVKKKFQ